MLLLNNLLMFGAISLALIVAGMHSALANESRIDYRIARESGSDLLVSVARSMFLDHIAFAVAMIGFAGVLTLLLISDVREPHPVTIEDWAAYGFRYLFLLSLMSIAIRDRSTRLEARRQRG